jgi:hypothetical protein
LHRGLVRETLIGNVDEGQMDMLQPDSASQWPCRSHVATAFRNKRKRC